MKSRELDPDSEFSFCEHVTAYASGNWHIRRLGPDGPKFGGGASAPLCFLSKELPWLNGWDLNVAFGEDHFEAACPSCLKLYQEEVADA